MVTYAPGRSAHLVDDIFVDANRTTRGLATHQFVHRDAARDRGVQASYGSVLRDREDGSTTAQEPGRQPRAFMSDHEGRTRGKRKVRKEQWGRGDLDRQGFDASRRTPSKEGVVVRTVDKFTQPLQPTGKRLEPPLEPPRLRTDDHDLRAPERYVSSDENARVFRALEVVEDSRKHARGRLLLSPHSV